VKIYGITRRNQPALSAEAVAQEARVGGRGELIVLPMTQGTYPLADEGGYFKGTNPTVGTGIIHALTTSFSATAALFCLRNTDGEGAKRLYLDYVKLVTGATAIGMTAATSIETAVTIDNTNRHSSGGSAITPVNVNMDSSQATIAALNFGAEVLAAASGSVRLVGRHAFPRRVAPAMVTGDQFVWDFGSFSSPSIAAVGAAAPATAPMQHYAAMGPVIIGGGDSLNFHLWYPAGATTAPTYEFEIAWWER
jgi:hypothetical protein